MSKQKTKFLEQYKEYLAKTHPVDIKNEIIRPALEQIIDDFEDSGNNAIGDLESQEIANSFCDQGWWLAIFSLVNKA